MNFQVISIKSYNSFYLALFFLLIPLADVLLDIHTREFAILGIGLWGFTTVCNPQELKNFKVLPLDVVILIFTAYYLFSFTFLSTNTIWYDGFWWQLSLVLLYFILRLKYLYYTHKLPNTFVILIQLRCVLELVILLFQYVSFLPSRNPYFEGTGTFHSPNYLAIYLVIGLVSLVWFFGSKSLLLKKKYLRNTLIVYGIVLLVVVLAIHSRAAILALLFSVVYLIYVQFDFKIKVRTVSKRLKIAGSVLLLCTLFLGGYYAYHSKKDSVAGRALIAKISMPEIFKKPVFGHGPFTFREGYNRAKSNYFTVAQRDWNEIKNATYVAHAFNDFLELLYEMGVVGLLFLGLIMVLIFETKTKDHTIILARAIIRSLVVVALFFAPSSNYDITVLGVFGLLVTNRIPIDILVVKRNKNVLLIFLLIFATLGVGYSGIRIGTRFRYTNTIDGKIALEKKKAWLKILSDGGNSAIKAGMLVYKNGQIKEGLRLMELGTAKNRTPKNIFLLAKYHLKSKNYPRVEELLHDNIGNQPYRFAPRMELLKFYTRTKQNRKRCSIAHDVIQLPVKIPSPKIIEYKKKCGAIISSNTCY